jgi:hypothetical protein
MDVDTGSALFQEKVQRSQEALAIEVVTLRAWGAALLDAFDQLTIKIESVAAESDGAVLVLSKCAGGLAAVQLLKDWAQESLGTINDFIVTVADGD